MFYRQRLLITLLTSFAAVSAHASSSTITFLGAITESTCQVSVQLTTINTQCPRTAHVNTAQVRQMAKGTPNDFAIVTMKVTWLDKSQQKGIITTTYR